MANKQEIQQCIQACTQAANQLRTVANGVNNSAVRDMLTEGARHVELCIRQCESAMMMF
ncbi:MAG: hypothetical protein K6U74_14705 [Firmicutes bacterium]|nr:hypothetical protein [Bacillota bacterium]